MNLPCCISSPCFDPSNPIANYSAEVPDAEVFIGFNSGWGNNVPPIGDSWGTLGCTSFCQSTISQADADACAANQQLACTTQKGGGGNDNPGWQDPSGNPTRLFANRAAHCDIICADGLPFRFTVAAGQYTALSQFDADAIAQSFACIIGQSERLCLNKIPGSACIGLNYGADIYTEGGTLPISYTVVSGTIPFGMSFTQISSYACEIAGVPTTPGNYSFTIRAVDRFGLFMVKTYHLTVLGVVGGLPDGTVNAAYSYQIPVTGGTGPFVIGVPSGVVPAGLTVSASGLISGTPTAQGTSTFQVSMLDSATGFTCYQNLSLMVVEACVADTGPAVPLQWNGAAQPARLRIVNYQAFADALSACPACVYDVPPEPPVWDGTLPFQYAPDNFNLRYQPSGSTGPAVAVKLLVGANLNIWVSMELVFISGQWWKLEINCFDILGHFVGNPVWLGHKVTGLTPNSAAGTYMIQPGSLSPGPACLHVEAY